MPEKPTSTVAALRLWTIFSLGRSTAIVVPVLPLFLMQHRGISVEGMLEIASYFVLVPVMLEVPMGMLGDRFGHRAILIIGTLTFLTGFAALAVDMPHAYPLYLLCIGIAAACYSGCEPIYLKSILPRGLSFRQVVSEVNERVYLISSLMLLVGGLFYTLSPSLPILIQIACLAAATIAVCVLPSAECQPRSVVHDGPGVSVLQKRALGAFIALATLIIMYSGLFSAFVQLTSRTVQIQLAQSFDGSPYIKLGMAFALGNLFSAIGSRLVRHVPDRWTDQHSLSFAAIVASVSAWLLSSDSNVCLSSGFFLLCVFKGFFRPPLTQAIRSIASRATRQATAYSTINVLAASIAALLHYAAALTYLDMRTLYGAFGLTLAGWGMVSAVVWIMLRRSHELN